MFYIKRKNFQIIPNLLLISSFGVYLSDFGLQTSHLLIYPLFFLSSFVYLRKRKVNFRNRAITRIIKIWLLILFWLILSTIFSKSGFLFYQNILATLDNYLIPLMVIVIMSVFFQIKGNFSEYNILKSFCNFLIIVLVINTIIIIANMIWDLSFFIDFFQPARDLSRGTNVWERSMSMGRHVGIFSGPFDAGITYTLGLFCWLYLRIKTKKSKIIDQLIFIFLFIGGVLTVSKAFLYSIPILLLYALFNIRNFKNFFDWKLILIFSLIAPSIFSFINKYWNGLDFLLRLFDFNNASLALLTSNRYGDINFGVMRKISTVLEESPFFGFGIGERIIVDNGYLEILWIGGIVGLILYFFILLSLLLEGFSKRVIFLEANFLLFLMIYVIFASFGAPVVTQNHFSIIFWVLIILLLFSISNNIQKKKLT